MCDIERVNPFDQKFGPELIATAPNSPGVYRYADSTGSVIYVGKAKNLRRRLSQYRLATKAKKHRRMRRIVREASSLTWEETGSHLEACLLEVRQIQTLRPRRNVAASFSFLYPYIGLAQDAGLLHIVYTTTPEPWTEHQLFGAYRSREICGEAFFSLMRLMTFIGHKTPLKASTTGGRRRYSYLFSFRRLPDHWLEGWTKFFRGESRAILEELTFQLLECASARAKASEVQEDLKALLGFWHAEALPLAKAIAATAYQGSYPVPQIERDPLFIQFRLLGASSL